MAQTITPVALRVPPDLAATLTDMARALGVSRNGLITAMLEREVAMTAEGGVPDWWHDRPTQPTLLSA